MFKRHESAVPIRGVHLDLKGLPPTFDRLERLLELFAAMRFNAVLIEWENMFPWEFDRRLRCEGSYSRSQVGRFHQRCHELGLEVIPLVQCLGHMENLLQIDDYAHLRERPDRTDCINPLAAESAATIKTLVEEMIEQSPGIRHFHLGGDEAWSLGQSPASRRYIESHGSADLYMHHVEPLLEVLNERGIRPILWHDMMIQWSDKDLQRIGEQADLMVWGYRGTPIQNRHHHRSEVLDRLHADGVQLWGASAYKGSDGTHADLPDTDARIENSLGWAQAVEPYQLKGVIATGWSRYGSTHIQVEPIDGALPVLALVAAVLHDGALTSDSAACGEALLRELGEWEQIEPLRQGLGALQDACGESWMLLRQIEEFLAGLATDPTRIEGGSGQRLFTDTRNQIKTMMVLADRIPQLLHGLVAEPWASRYAEPRVQAIHNALKSLEMRYNQFIKTKATLAPAIKVTAPSLGSHRRAGIGS